MQDIFQSHTETQPLRTQPARFLDHMQQLFGEDPDPLFLEESWSVGVPAAIENLHRRRSHRASHSSADRAIRELERIAALTGVPSSIDNTQAFLADRSQPIDSRYLPASLHRTTQPRPSTHQPQPLASHIGATHACQLLGVSATATREEIRSAYRRRVIQCHPDRFPGASDAIYRTATQQLADLNQAYRLLCEDLLNQAA
jgi:DnaJ-domain-containing protein 1